MSEKIAFEEAVAELENIVKTLENGDYTLDNSIELFKKGVELSALCDKKLKEADKAMLKLTTVDEVDG